MKAVKALVVFAGLPGLGLAQECADIEDNAERLACYDAQSGKVSESAPERQQAPPAPDEQQAPTAAVSSGVVVAAESTDAFGRRESVDAPKQYIEAKILEIITQGTIDYLRLDNGQVWRETKANSLRFREGRGVTITEGILNSYDLKMEGQKKIVKVKRVR